MTEIVAIVGSREYPDINDVRDYIDTLRFKDVTIVTGGARGWIKWPRNTRYLSGWRSGLFVQIMSIGAEELRLSEIPKSPMIVTEWLRSGTVNQQGQWT